VGLKSGHSFQSHLSLGNTIIGSARRVFYHVSRPVYGGVSNKAVLVIRLEFDANNDFCEHYETEEEARAQQRAVEP
jgi:hypothetical protein